MAQKKNLWQRLFSSAADEEMGLSVADRRAIQESLESEYGLTIQQDNVAASDLTTRNYRKLTGKNSLVSIRFFSSFHRLLQTVQINKQQMPRSKLLPKEPIELAWVRGCICAAHILLREHIVQSV